MTRRIGLADDAEGPGRDLGNCAGTWPMDDDEAEEILGDIYRLRDQSAGGRRLPDLR